MVFKAVAVMLGDATRGIVKFEQTVYFLIFSNSFLDSQNLAPSSCCCQSENAPVRIYGEIKGLQKGLHGFHIHEYGDTTNGEFIFKGEFSF